MVLQRSVPWVTAGLLLLAAWLAAQLSWQLLALFSEVDIDTSPAGQPAVVQQPLAASYQLNNILAVPLFGERKQDAAVVATQDVKRSRLNIKLRGVVASGSESGVAILFHDGKEHAYAAGDRLNVREAITLQSVLEDHVIISRNGALEKIELEKLRSRSASGQGVARVPRNSSVDLNTEYIRRLVGDPRTTLKNNPLRLMRYLTFTPYVQAGRTVGFTIKSGRDKRLFPKLGLQEGDVVTAVNNQSVGEVPMSDLLNSLDNNTSFEITVLRNGATEIIRLTL